MFCPLIKPKEKKNHPTPNFQINKKEKKKKPSRCDGWGERGFLLTKLTYLTPLEESGSPDIRSIEGSDSPGPNF